MHKFWVIAVGCALSVGTGVASDPDQVDERAANSDEVVFVVKVPDLGHEQSATVELEPSLQRGNLVEAEAHLIRLEGNKYSLDLGADQRGVIEEIYVEDGDEVVSGQKLMKIVY